AEPTPGTCHQYAHLAAGPRVPVNEEAPQTQPGEGPPAGDRALQYPFWPRLRWTRQARIGAPARTPVTPGGRFALRKRGRVAPFAYSNGVPMSKIVQLKAAARSRAGKGAARAVRRDGRIPGVLYGDKKEPQNISFAYRDLQPHVHTGRILAA